MVYMDEESEKRWSELFGKSKTMYQMAHGLFTIGKEKYGLKTVREAYDLIVEKFERDDNSWPEEKKDG